MDNVPPPSPALVVQLDPAEAIRQMSGTPVYRSGSLNTRIIGGCWADGILPAGWSPAPLVPELTGCGQPDLRTPAGQQWQRLLNVPILNAAERLAAR